MSYYLVKVNFDTGEFNKKNEPILKKSEFLVAAECIFEAETKIAEYMTGTIGGFETFQISKTKIEAVVYSKDHYEEQMVN